MTSAWYARCFDRIKRIVPECAQAKVLIWFTACRERVKPLMRRGRRTRKILRKDLRYLRRRLVRYNPTLVDEMDEVYDLTESLMHDPTQRRVLE